MGARGGSGCLHGAVVRAARAASVVRSRRGALRGDTARDAERRRLGHSSSQCAGVLGEASPAVLAHGAGLRRSRAERIHGSAVHGDRRIFVVGGPAFRRRQALGSRRRSEGPAVRLGLGPVRAAGTPTDARHAVELLSARRLELLSDGATAAGDPRVVARVDAGLLGCHGARRAHQGIGRCADSRRHPGGVPGMATGLAAVASTESSLGTALVRGSCRTLVRAAARADPRFLRFFFVREHFQRFLTPIEHRTQPWWFFVPVLVVGIMPWLPQAVRALLSPCTHPAPGGRFDAARFLWIWCVFVLLFFSLSDSKLVTYILPAVPALALLCAGHEAGEARGSLLAGSALSLASSLGVLAFTTGLWSSAESRPLLLLIRPVLFATCALLALGALACAACALRGRSREALAALSL